jgi:ATP-dependent DNA helicase RecG
MVIESAERFGLSQLHQLRGRVGRGAEQSYCVLVSSYKLSNDTRKRLEIWLTVNDGFEIAEADLRLVVTGIWKAPAERRGDRSQNCRSVVRRTLLQYARDMAQMILAEDPDLTEERNLVLNKNLRSFFPTK